MKLSVIIPAHRAEKTLPRTLESVNAAGVRWSEATGSRPTDVEVVVSWDREGRGPSWARNRGLERATGDYVFFCDADDVVAADFFLKPAEALTRTGAEMCLFGFNGLLPRRDYDLVGNEAVRAVFLPAVFGYSFDDVRRWNRGGDLWASREWAMVWRVAFRRDFLLRHALRFDEEVRYCEDAMFLSECATRCERMCSVAASLYEYRDEATGLLAEGRRGADGGAFRFQMLAFRKRLDAACGGGLWPLGEGSVVFSAIRLFREHGDWRRFVADPDVRRALRGFPLSLRHPLVAAAVLCLRGAA